MTSFDFVDKVASIVLEALLNSLWLGLVLTILVGCLLRLIRRANAATRYAIWYVTLIVCIGLPLLFTLAQLKGGSARRQPLPASSRGDGASSPAASRGDEAANQRPSRVNEGEGHGRSITSETSLSERTTESMAGSATLSGEVGQESGLAALQIKLPLRRWALGLFVGWLLIAGYLVVRIALSYHSIQGRRRQFAATDSDKQESLQRGLAAYDITRSVSLHSSREISLPMVVGLANPVILIPEWLEGQLSETEFEQVMLHELAHVRRWDDWTHLLYKLAEAVFFFHPSVYWIGRRLNLEREVACDDLVISVTGRDRQYALCLTKLAELIIIPRRMPVGSAAILNQTYISKRIERLLAAERGRSPSLSKVGLLASVGMSLMFAHQCVKAASVFVITGQRGLLVASQDEDSRLRVGLRKEPGVSAALIPAQEERGFQNGANVGGFGRQLPAATQNVNVQAVLTNARRRTRAISLNADPALAASPVIRAKESDPSPALATASENSKKISLTNNLLPPLTSDQQVVENLIVNGNSKADVLSNAEKATALLEMVKNSAHGEALPPAFSSTFMSINSGWEQRRVLSFLLETEPRKGIIIQILKLAAAINSDGEKATLLVKAARASPDDENVLSTFLEVAATINSSWEKERALSALLRRDNLDKGTLRLAAVMAENKIASAHSRQNLMLKINKGLSK